MYQKLSVIVLICALSHYSQAVSSDYDGDGKSDITIVDRDISKWRIRNSSSTEKSADSDEEIQEITLEMSESDIPVSGDFDGDGIPDVALRRPDTFEWVIRHSSTGETYIHVFGLHRDDIPVTGDYDGDGITDLAVRRPSTQMWYIKNSSGSNWNSDRGDGIQRILFGQQSSDIPTPADYDGDGLTDIAVRRPSTQMWYIKNSSGSNLNSDRGDGIQRIYFGQHMEDIPVPGDFDGDGRADVAVWRPSTGYWYVKNSSNTNFNSDLEDGVQRVLLGQQPSDIPILADYDGDGLTDMAVRRAETSMFYIRNSSRTNYNSDRNDGIQRIHFGEQQDIAVPINPVEMVLLVENSASESGNNAPIFGQMSSLNIFESDIEITTLTATDKENDILSYTIDGGEDEALFNLTTDGDLSFNIETDFELPNDSDENNIYHLIAKVSDGQDFDTIDLYIEVLDALEGRVVDGPLADADIFVADNLRFNSDEIDLSAKTNSEGYFRLKDSKVLSEESSYLISIGGLDSQTDIELFDFALFTELSVSSPPFTAITPLTSILTLARNDTEAADFLTAFSLADDLQQIKYSDIWQRLLEGDSPASDTQKLSQQLAILIQFFSDIAMNDTDNSNGVESTIALAETLMQLIRDNYSPLSLTSSECVGMLVNEVVTQLSALDNYDTEALDIIATRLSELNSILADASVAPHRSDATFLLSIIQTEFRELNAALLTDAMELSEYVELSKMEMLFADWQFSSDIADTDNDGLADLIDPDDDNDGVPDDYDAFPEDPTRWQNDVTVSLSVVNDKAYETTGLAAEIKINRAPLNAGSLNVSYSLSGNDDSRLGSASADDYALSYADGSNVGTEILFAEGEDSISVFITPNLDQQREVPETLTITLETDANYELDDAYRGSVTINDATNTEANKQVFLGSFEPQDGAATNGSGLLSFVLQGDNDLGVLTYTYQNLGAVRTDQHIHLSPSGTIIKDIPDSALDQNGNLIGYEWDLLPGGIFTTKQDMLDTLFEGKFYVNVHSADYPAGEILAHLMFESDVEPPNDSGLTAAQVDRDIIRFLNQATFGATPSAYQSLRTQIDEVGTNRLQVYELWIDEQFAMQETSMLNLDDHLAEVFEVAPDERDRIQTESFWPIALHARDQLRQRMAYNLSQILVISMQDSSINKIPRGTASYWDMLAKGAFGYYNQLLRDVATHPMMGIYLSHFRNSKAVPETGYFPDENFAREIMQLFSFGLVHRNLDGSVVLDENNLPISTYDNDVIQNLARVFTGLGLRYTSDNDGSNVRDNQNFNRKRCGQDQYTHYCWTQPMKFFPDYHDFEPKTLFTDNGNTLLVTQGDATEETAEEELTSVIDAIVAHNTTAPFFAKQLIQRMVTSNPSGPYIESVATAFAEKGDMQAVIKAILLNSEARSPSVLESQTFGKVKEPIVLFASLLRLMDVQTLVALGEGDPTNGIVGTQFADAALFRENATILKLGKIVEIFGQQPLLSPSVFNFYPPDYSPTGQLSAQGLLAPELKLFNETQLYKMFNAYDALMSQGYVSKPNPFSRQQLLAKFDDRILAEVWTGTEGGSQEKAEAIVDFLDFYMNAAKLKQDEDQETRETLITNIAGAVCEQQSFFCERYALAVYAAATTPGFHIQQ